MKGDSSSGNPSVAFAGDTRKAIFEALRQGYKTPLEISAGASLDYAKTKQALKRMADAGELNKEGRGQYALPSDHQAQA